MRIGFIGAGNMASAIISGVTGAKLMSASEIGIFDVSQEKQTAYRDRGFKVFDDIESLVCACEAVVIAVKPQNITDILPHIKAGMSPDKLIVSIAAGITAESIKQGVGFDCKVILAMPNTPLLLGCGATALGAVPPATEEDFVFAQKLFASAGIAVRIPPDRMKEIIPVNGSSPAFYYYFAKLIAESAEKSGIEYETAYRLACQSMLGSAKMMLESGKTAQELIDMVCSPGGTTLAGMKAMEEHGFAGAVDAASRACVGRAYELAELNRATNKPEAKPNVGKPDCLWYENSIFYQIYTLGFCGAPEKNDGIFQSRIEKVMDWIPHLLETGIDAVYFGPVFESDSHGYDTRDYSKIDCRLGSNDNFAEVCRKLHESGIKVVLDGVFNHVGRGFWAFRDLLENRQNSQYKDWFIVDFNRNNNFNDGLWYEGWEGHFELVKLNLNNPAVRGHIFDCIRGWIKEFDIDGLRLDVAYMLNEDFMRALRSFVKQIRPDFFLVGEVIHGDYNRIVNGSMLDSCTNYECYKGIYSSFNDRNMFEVAHSLNRQFGPEQWTCYKGLHLFNFVDNHDVTRIASRISEERNLVPAHGLLYGMPGIPCVYYGSEWGEKAEKTHGTDAPLRPCFDEPRENALTGWISRFSGIRRENPALTHGNYRQLYLTNLQFVFLREIGNSRVIVAINADSHRHTASLPPLSETLCDLVSGKRVTFSGKLELEPHSAGFFRLG